jgi:phosphate:Na+ symporter
MEFLKDALKPLREVQAFNDAMINLSHSPILGVLVGFVLTFMVQSSSASICMLIALASQGVLPLTAAIPILEPVQQHCYHLLERIKMRGVQQSFT